MVKCGHCRDGLLAQKVEGNITQDQLRILGSKEDTELVTIKDQEITLNEVRP